MRFDIDGARQAGFSDEEIATHLSRDVFDLEGALEAGFSYTEIAERLAGLPDPGQAARRAPVAQPFRRPEEPEDLKDDRTFLGQVRETIRGVPRGFANTLLTSAEGAAELANVATNLVGLPNLIRGGEENAVVRAARAGRDAVANSFLAADPTYADAWWTKFGDGVGSMATFVTPTVLLRAAGAAGRVGRWGMSGREFAITSTLGATAGAGDQAQRIEAARQSGIEIDQATADKAIALGGLIGLTEVAPLALIFRGIPKNVDRATKNRLLTLLASGITSGTAEGIQETTSTILQDLTERNLYNPDVPFGESLWDDFTIGASVGFFTDFVLNAVGGRRRYLTSQAQTQRELDLREQRENQVEEIRRAITAEQERRSAPPPINTLGKYFAGEDVNRVLKDATNYKSRTAVVEMPIDNFLSLARPGFDEVKAAGAAQREVFNSLPFLSVGRAKDGVATVRGHEGRHRALELKKRGETHIPVAIRSDNIRFDQQNDPSSFDYIAPNEYPATLRAEDSDFSVAFPVSQGKHGIISSFYPAETETLAQAAMARAQNIPAPQEGRAPVKTGQAYGKQIANEMGMFFPVDEAFTVTEGPVVDTPQGERAQTYIVRDSEGSQYGQPLFNYEQAAGLAYELNNQVVVKNVANSVLNILETSGESYDQSQAQTLMRYGWQALNPDANLFTATAINDAAGTTVDKGYLENVNSDQILAGEEVFSVGPEGNLYKRSDATYLGEIVTDSPLAGYAVKLPDGTEFITPGLTAAQKINQTRREQGLPETQLFTLEEAKQALGRDFSKLGELVLTEDAQAQVRGKRHIRQEIIDLIGRKNIASEVTSPEMKALFKSITGKSTIRDMSPSEQRILLSRLASLPKFEQATKLPVFEAKPYTRANFALASKFVQDADSTGTKVSDEALAEAAGIPLNDPRIEQKTKALREDLAKQGATAPKAKPQEKVLALPAPDDTLNYVRGELKKMLEGQNLGDISARVDEVLLNYGQPGRIGEAMAPETEGYYNPFFKEIVLALDRVDPSKTLTPEQRLNALVDIMNHEIVHPVREMDLWKAQEWDILGRAANNLAHRNENGVPTSQTFMQWAEATYPDYNPLKREEEAVAEMIRQTKKYNATAGKPRSLADRFFRFFDRLDNALRGAGFQSYQDIIAALESGELGARQRGEVRTLLRTEQQMLEQADILPERFGDYSIRVTSTLVRNEDREAVWEEIKSKAQKEGMEVPTTFATPAAILEARNSAERLPDIMEVGGVRRPTKDSEGNIIYSGLEGSDLYGIQTLPTMEGIRRFWRWFGDSQAVDNKGRPLLYFHGTARVIDAFTPKQANSVFITLEPSFAEGFANLSTEYMVQNFPDFMTREQLLEVVENSLRSTLGVREGDFLDAVYPEIQAAIAEGRPFRKVQTPDGEMSVEAALKAAVPSYQYVSSDLLNNIQLRLSSGANVLPLYVRAESAFDYENADHVSMVFERLQEISPVELTDFDLSQLASGDWTYIESANVLETIRELGFDSMYVEEAGRKNLAVFSPDQIKSAIGNNGTFGPGDFIMESRKSSPVRIPSPEELAVILPIGRVEEALVDLFKAENSPTSEQLAEMPGAPTPRMVVNDDGTTTVDPRDENVRPRSMEELREMARIGIQESDNLRWYDMFGKLIQDIVGKANLGEAAVIFGITSQQNSAEANLADTLHIMRLAREFDPVNDPQGFEEAVRQTPRTKDERLKITGNQINRIIALYRDGFAEAGIKTSTYMQLIRDRAENIYNPFSVQDVHMARVFGFMRQEVSPKSGKLVDAAVIPGDPQYRYAQYLTSKLAEEFGLLPDRMQAALWFYAKTNLSPKVGKKTKGTPESAQEYAKDEIKYIKDMVDSGTFDKSQALTPALREGVTPQNALKTLTAPYSNLREADQLLELARARAPRILTSATPGASRGFALDLPMDKLLEFNQVVLREITDEGGQIPFLRDLGIPHEIALGWGTYGTLEPNIQVKLLGGTADQAKMVTAILGDALGQDAAIFEQPTMDPNRVNTYGLRVMKADGSDFTVSELENISQAINPQQLTDDGINFTLVQPNMLTILDARSFGDDYNVDTMLNDFYNSIQSSLPTEMSFDVGLYYQDGEFYGHEDYSGRMREAWNSGLLGGRPDILSRINDTLYKRYWDAYTAFRTENNLGAAEQSAPVFPLQASEVGIQEARRRKPDEVPGPAVETDGTSAAEALNGGRPVNAMGVPIGDTVGTTEPDLTVASARLDAPLANFAKVVGFFESAPDRLRRSGNEALIGLADRIVDYFDNYRARLGSVNSLIKEATDQIELFGTRRATRDFEAYTRAKENGRTEEANRIFAGASVGGKALIESWRKINAVTAQVNQSVRAPNGDPLEVWDASTRSWRPIRTAADFFPRTLRKEVMEVMNNPDLDRHLWDQLLDAVVAQGRAENRQAAEKYLLREYFTEEVRNDYFAGVEKARSEALPEIFYDYSWDAATRYLDKWAKRTSQVEQFGQDKPGKRGPDGKDVKDWFDTNIPKVRDENTQVYLAAVRDRIYEKVQRDPLTQMMGWANLLATGLQLGNPGTAALNLIGGTTLNIQEFGWKNVLKSYKELLTDWRAIQNEGVSLGILRRDLLNILRDADMEGSKYFTQGSTTSQALAKFSQATMKWGGYTGTENIIRATGMLAARNWLQDSLNAVNKNPNSMRSKKFFDWTKRENISAEKLIMEGGHGAETAKFLRRAVNIPQGSYQIDMTPVFVDVPVGRFFFKYQKFGTQVSRMWYTHTFKPFLAEPNARNFNKLLMFTVNSIIGGTAILAARGALFNYLDPGADFDEIEQALKNEDTARAWALIFSRAWHSNLAAGGLGFFGNYAQMAMDYNDQQRVKNPLSPPGIASIDAVIDLLSRATEQGRLTARDVEEVAENTISIYRGYKRMGLTGMDAVGADYAEVKRLSARRDIQEVRKYSRLYSKEAGVEGRRRIRPGGIMRTPMTPINREIRAAIAQGDRERARLLYREALQGLTGEERRRAVQSIQASVRNGQPIQIGERAPTQQQRAEFLRWARQNLTEERYRNIVEIDRRYRRAAASIGVNM